MWNIGKLVVAKRLVFLKRFRDLIALVSDDVVKEGNLLKGCDV